MTKYYIRMKGSKEWKKIDDRNVKWAIETFAVEECLDDGDIVEVKKHGEYRINIIGDPEYYTEKIT